MKTKKLSLAVALVLTTSVLAGCDLFKELPEGVTLPTEESNITASSPIKDAEAVKQLIVATYAAVPSSVGLDITNQTDDFMRGLVRIGKMPTKSGTFLAYKEGDAWKLAFQGNGPISCGMVQEKNFPPEMVSDCFGAGGSGKGYEKYPAITAEECSKQTGKLTKMELSSACAIGELPTGLAGDSICCVADKPIATTVENVAPAVVTPQVAPVTTESPVVTQAPAAVVAPVAPEPESKPAPAALVAPKPTVKK